MTPQAPIITPPTIAGRIGKAPARAAWPVWIGVVALALAVMSAFMAVSMVTSVRNFARIKVTNGTINPFQGMVDYATPLTISCAAAILVAGLAVAAAIGLMLRKRWSVPLVIAWAVLKLLCALAVSFSLGLAQKAQIDTQIAAAAASNPGRPGPPPGFAAAIGGGVAIVMAGFLFIWLILLPIFMLVWFSRRAVKEEVATWRPAILPT